MIRIPTMFILGAGASQPYGLPLGDELRHLICHAENPGDEARRMVISGGEYTEHDIVGFANAFQRSKVPSIDDFLSRQQHFVGIGKSLIAANICLRENRENVIDVPSEDDWYQLVWRQMIYQVEVPQQLPSNLVSFVTFNYDRSLEYFLHTATKNTFGLNDVEAWKIWSKFSIIHIYGQVGGYSFNGDGSFVREYRRPNDSAEVQAAAGGINIIPEGRNGAREFSMVRRIFDDSRNVFILGFGFDELNCERLGLYDVLKSKRDKRDSPAIFASVLGMTNTEIERARRNLIGQEGLWHAMPEKNRMALRTSSFPD